MQKKISSISIAIVTKNRSQKLSRCLFSILNQSHHPDVVIVIDNDPKLSAKNLTEKSAFAPLSISYFPSSGTVPECRNLALAKSKTRYLGFVDDDCVLKENWLMYGLSSLVLRQQAFVVGHTLLLNPNNIFALAQHARDNYWKERSIYRGDYQEVFDTKNIILDVEKIRKYNLKFDRKCHFDVYDSADFDFGFQLKKAKLLGSYCSKMQLFHEETSTYQRFISRAYARGKITSYISDKWNLGDELINSKDNFFDLWLLRLIKHFYMDFQRYYDFIPASMVKKVLAIVSIKIIERHYALGYLHDR